MKNIPFVAVCLFMFSLLAACGDPGMLNEAYSKYDPARSLSVNDTCVLKLNIVDNRKPYEFVGVISAEKSFSNLPLRVTEIDPFGEKVMMDIDVIMSAKQQESGEVDEFEFAIDQHKQFHMHGTYTYIFQLRSVANAQAEGITMLGLRVR